ncbi:MAG: DNA methyltransferase [Ktedonobacteraceae bacterium]
MNADIQDIKSYLKSYNFSKLFREVLGWDQHPEASHPIVYGEQRYEFTLVAEKFGFKIYLHTCASRIPDMALLKQLDEKLNVRAAAHLTIFVDAQHDNQLWLWIKRDGKRSIVYPTRLSRIQSGELLAQKVNSLYVDLKEEEKGDLTLIDILNRVMRGFDVEKVTQTFYNGFKDQHGKFLAHIKNIPDEDDCKWYTSIMLNRLMFVYFIQRKGLLNNPDPHGFNGDREYLQRYLEAIQQKPDNRYAFYRDFLRPLFHKGLNEREHSRELTQIIGDVPYLNGGIFDVHYLEDKYHDIQISNEAFKGLFDFFTTFTWHLDERPTRNDKEINPDVLGYIFEKYINQKQMGAYYTKEDITGYISKNTIIPYIFEKAAQYHAAAFAPGGPIWSLLQQQPDAYIYEAMSHGLLEDLPANIEAGVTDVAQRGDWNQPANEQWALETETWREVVARRQRYHEVRRLMEGGQISTINDLITYNLNITQFAEDVIATCSDAGLLHAFYDAITHVTILDPTCGSGAFLFAALHILRLLYQACIARMATMLDQSQRKQFKVATDHSNFFQSELSRVGQHRRQQYFILKSIIVNNLYGVDIMEEAIEICKLRLFLNMVAQLETPEDLEPLPDIDFNVLAGNTLIGFTNIDEVRRVVTEKLLTVGNTEKALANIEWKVKEIEREEQSFREMQTRLGIDIDSASMAEQKQRLRAKLNDLRDILNPYLATEYGIGDGTRSDENIQSEKYKAWEKNYHPFHWWAEFYKIVENGGFDVIIGNPPYVEWSKIKEYNLLSDTYSTRICGNLYTVVCERAYLLLRSLGYFGMIVPISCIATDRMEALRFLWHKKNFETHISHYSGDAHPSVLFQGVKFRLSIVLQHASSQPAIYSTYFQRWLPQGRNHLFSLIRYAKIEPNFIRLGLIPKVTTEPHSELLRKMCSEKSILEKNITRTSDHQVYCHRIVAHFIKATDFVPFFKNERDGQKKSEDYKVFPTPSKESRDTIVVLLNSNLFYLWFVTFSDVYHCGREIILNFPCNIDSLMSDYGEELHTIKDHLMESLQHNSIRRTIPYKATGLVQYDEFYPRKSKPIIDEIDRVLAHHYGFTPEELDFIINYDIKYRMGRDSGDDSE